MALEGWQAVLAFVGAAGVVGLILWAGATGRIGSGKPPMNAPEVDPHPRCWED